MVAGGGLFVLRFDKILRPTRKLQRSLIHDELLVMKWYFRIQVRLRGRARGSLKGNVSENPCYDKNVHQRNFKKEKPAQPHQLVPSKSRKRPAHPHKEKNHYGDLCEENSDVDQPEDPAV